MTETVRTGNDTVLDSPKVDEQDIEVRLDHQGNLDEIVAAGCFVHLEQLADNEWWLGITKGSERLSVRLTTRRATIDGWYEREQL